MFREYKCRAENPLGAAEYEIELEEAREPGVINQVQNLIIKIFSTTLELIFFTLQLMYVTIRLLRQFLSLMFCTGFL